MFILPGRRSVRTVLQLLLTLAALHGSTSVAQVSPDVRLHTTDIEASFIAQRSLRASTDQNFWFRGASVEAGLTFRGSLGAAMNVTGSHTASVGTSTVPLSFVTVTAGPRFRPRSNGKWSPYGEALFGLASGFDSTFPLQSGSAASATSLAVLAGGGVDLKTRSEAFFLRVLDVSYVRTQLPNGTDNVQNTLRIGAGIGWRFVGR